MEPPPSPRASSGRQQRRVAGRAGRKWREFFLSVHRGPNVLVMAEQVRGVVLVLQGDQPCIVLSEGGPDPVNPLLSLSAQDIDVATPHEEGFHRLRRLAYPPHMSLRPPRVQPGGHEDQLVLRLTMAEGACVLGTTAGGATHLLKQHKGSGRGDVSKVGDEDVNGFVADFLYQGRFLVVLLPGGNHSVKHSLEL